MSIGKLSEFNVKTGQWSSYVDRLDMYFKVNGVADVMKLPTLIALIGDEAYELLVNLASPRKPADLTYSEADALMRQHLQPAPSSLAERYRFRQKRQGAGEDVAVYVAELKRLSRNCKFASNLNENLRDQFICGLRSDVIRQRLFAEDDAVTFAQAVKLASSLEAAERDAAAVETASTSSSPTVEVHAVTSSVESNGPSYGGNSRRGRGRGPGGVGGVPGGTGLQSRGAPAAHKSGRGDNSCTVCGATNHSWANCRYRDYVCSKCQRVGHLRRVCPGNSGQSPRRPAYQRGSRGQKVYFGDAGSEPEEDEEVNLNLIGLNNYKPVSLPLCIENTVLNMEVDTGTAISCISKITYEMYFTHLPLEDDDTILKFYDGSKLKPLGIIRPIIKCGELVRIICN